MDSIDGEGEPISVITDLTMLRGHLLSNSLGRPMGVNLKTLSVLGSTVRQFPRVRVSGRVNCEAQC